ncbi:MAG: prepilin peptidase [Eubacterium sp.]|nr:prepilin peptidase [Eubacterium sp.]
MNTTWIGIIAAAVLLSFSVILLGGQTIRSRMEKPVGWGYLTLLVLPFTTGISVLLLWTGGEAVQTLRMVLLCSFLPLVAVIDHREMIIPNRLLLWMLAYWGLAMGMFLLQDPGNGWDVLVDSLLGGLIGASPLLVRLISKGGIGMGDIKLFTMVGLYVGKEDILRAMFLSLLLALIVLAVRKLRKRLAKREEVSFGPFVAVGTMLMVLMNIPIF